MHLLGHSSGARLALVAAGRAPAGSVRTLALYELPIAAQHVPEDTWARGRAATAAQDWEAVLDVFQPAAGMSPDEIAFCRAVPAVHEAQLDAARTVLREDVAMTGDAAGFAEALRPHLRPREVRSLSG